MTLENVERTREYYNSAEGAHIEYCNIFKRNMGFFSGKDQWSARDIKYAQQQGRPIVVLPLIKPMAKMVMGLQAQNPIETRCSPREGGDKLTAELLSDTMQYCYDGNEMDMIDGIAFASGIVARRGYFSLHVDHTFDPRFGKIVIDSEDPRNIMLDPDGKKYDGSDDSFRIRLRYMTKPEIGSEFGEDKIKNINYEGFMSGLPGDVLPHGKVEELNRYKVIENQWRKYVTQKQLLDFQTGRKFDINNNRVVIPELGTIEHEVSDLMDYFKGRYYVHNKKVPKVYVTIICGEEEMSHGELRFNGSNYCAQHFSIIGYYPNYLFGDNSCIVDDLIDIQREENITHSQLLHLINVIANSGWVMEQGAVVNENVLRDFGSAAGVVIELLQGKLYGTHLRRLEPGTVPPLEKFLNTRQKGYEIANLNPAMMGLKEGEESGRAIALKLQQGTMGLLPDLSPYVTTKRMVGKFLLGAIQTSMPPEQAMRIIEVDKYLPDEVKDAQRMGQKIPDTLKKIIVNKYIGEKLQDYDAAQYDVICHESPKSIAKRQAEFDKLRSLREMGIYISDKQMVKGSDLSNEDEVLEDIERMEMAQGMPPAPGAASGGVPPGVVPEEELAAMPQDEFRPSYDEAMG